MAGQVDGGEEIAAARVAEHGLAGDRAHALVDTRDGRRPLSARRAPAVLGWAAAYPGERDGAFGASVTVERPGRVARGDSVEVQ